MATFGTFVSGQVLTAAELNGAGALQDYTPTWTQSATITKAVNWARYTQLNKWVYGSIKMTATSGGTLNTKVLVGLPVNAASNNFIIGSYTILDDSITDENRWDTTLCLYESATTMSFAPRGSSGGAVGGTTANVRLGEQYTSGGSTVNGWQIASGDVIYIQFAYEAA